MQHADECRALLRRWHETGDRAARTAVVERMLPLAHGLARRYANKGEPLDDLEQVACVGLLKAIDRFDVGRDVRFATFAVPTIAGELKRHFRDRGWMLRVPRDVQELATRLGRTREDLTRRLGRAPTVGELAGELRATVAQVVEALHAADAYRAMSLDEPLGADGPAPLDALGDDDEGFERAEQRLLLRFGFAALPPREREILRLRFFEGLTQREIAERVGISQMHVSRLIRRSVDALRATLEQPAEPPVAQAA
ncbi:MAG TPA: SigB/SigF/SigG family RNA polymerase sigma factor [Solirubrobacteraceae bacterium]|nr:SigB/SigF/SigG family RNA polymerase sigma factor [Solirubrobacteraceae bacterium]